MGVIVGSIIDGEEWLEEFFETGVRVEYKVTQYSDFSAIMSDGSCRLVKYASPSPSSPKWDDKDSIRSIILHNIVVGLQWNHKGDVVQKFFPEGFGAIVAPLEDLLVIVGGVSPNDALVLNPDGTLNHQIKAPKYVFKGGYVPGSGWVEPLHDDDMEVNFPRGSDTWIGVEVPGVGACYRVEGISHAYIEFDRVVIVLCFGYEWREERFYDTGKQKWLERLSVYRK